MSGLCIALAVLCVVLAASLGSTVSQIRKERKRFNSLNRQYHAVYQRFKNIIDIEEAHAHLSKLFNLERARAKSTMLDLKRKHDQMFMAHEQNKKQLNAETERIVHTINAHQEDLDRLTEKVHLRELGFYKPRYIFDTSERYKRKLDEIRNMQQTMLNEKKAAVCYSESTANSASKEGNKSNSDTLKLVLRAFNGECDAAVAKVNAKNVIVMERRINKAFEAINMLARFNHVEITHEYLRLKLNELYLTFEFYEKQEEEKEEQRKIREQMEETRTIQMELENAASEAKIEEERLTSLLAEAHKVAEDAPDEELTPLLEEIERIQKNLDQVQLNRKQTSYQLDQISAGHVYILSNIGSFGEQIYKIGMTRRLDPIAYIKQLGDSAVPFGFDIHALIYSDDAETMVAEIQRELAHHRINLVNDGSDFYRIKIEALDSILQKYDDDLEMKRFAEAIEYRKSLAIQKEELPEDRPPSYRFTETPEILLTVAHN